MVFIVLAALSTAHAVFSIFTNINTMPYFYVLHPLVYVGLWLLFCVVKGFEGRPAYKGQHAVLSVGMGFAVYITVFVLMGFLFGFAKNMMVPSANRAFYNFLIYGSFALSSEILRYRLIKEPTINRSTPIIALITVVFIFAQINNFTYSTDMFFSVLAPVIVLNVVLSYMAIEGTFGGLILLRGIFVLIPVLSPALPGIDNTLSPIVLQSFLFLVFMIYRMLLPKNEKAARELKKPFWKKHAVTIITVLVVIAFNAGLFPVFPSIIITDSMTGTLDKGSVAIMRKVNEKSFKKLNEGDIILFVSERNLMVTHRITEVHYGAMGEPYFTTKGDANENPDKNPVRKEQVKGVVFGRFKHIGMPRIWFNQLLR